MARKVTRAKQQARAKSLEQVIESMRAKQNLRKVADESDLAYPCVSPEHNPPSHMVYEPGVWEWTCTRCGEVQRFRVNSVHLGKSWSGSRGYTVSEVLFVLFCVVGAAIFIGGLYVAIHFIIKFW